MGARMIRSSESLSSSADHLTHAKPVVRKNWIKPKLTRFSTWDSGGIMSE